MRQRWRVVVGIFLLACVAVGVFVLSQSAHVEPVSYQSSVSIRIAQKPPKVEDKSNSSRQTTTTLPNIVLAGQQAFALRPGTRAEALKLSGLPANSPQVGFTTSLKPEGDVLALSVRAPTRVDSTKVARNWADAYVAARREAAAQQLQRDKIALSNRRTDLDLQLKYVNAILKNVMPMVYRDILRNNAPFGRGPDGTNGGELLTEPWVSADSPVAVSVLNLAYQRSALLERIDEISKRIAELNLAKETPEVFAEIMSQTPALRVTEAPWTAIPAGAGLLTGLLLAIAAAVTLDRFDGRIRTAEQAALAFRAPVLSIIPGGDLDFAVLADPLSDISQAYRGLAAASIATDRLPKAIMVSTPHGDAHEEVAANFAASLSRMGLRVALIATDSSQSWFTGSFASPALGTDGLPELLERAHDGTLNGDLRDRLATTERAPNLVLVPPAPEDVLELPLDGLPPLLEALSEAGIDIAVLAGPSILEHPDATIVAWVTRSVLWAVYSGHVTHEEAMAGAARLQLAGVTPFGVVMVGDPRVVTV